MSFRAQWYAACLCCWTQEWTEVSSRQTGSMYQMSRHLGPTFLGPKCTESKESGKPHLVAFLRVDTLCVCMFFTEVHRRTLDRSCQHAVFLADGRFVLQAPIVFWCPPVKRSTVVSRAFPFTSPKTWNALPEDVTSSQSEYTFCRQLKT